MLAAERPFDQSSPISLVGRMLSLGNPRRRASRGAAKIAGHRIWATDPTPVLAQLTASRSRAGAFLHSFSRGSLLDETPAGGELR